MVPLFSDLPRGSLESRPWKSRAGVTGMQWGSFTPTAGTTDWSESVLLSRAPEQPLPGGCGPLVETSLLLQDRSVLDE